MQTFKDKVAVITGAASGIGLALAQRCVQEGMKVVLADIEEEPLAKATTDLKASGATVLAVPTDVSQGAAVEALAQKTLDAFGAVHLLCNNAGVSAGTTAWSSTVADWEWVLGVNLWGVIHGVRVFVPIMLNQGTPCHVVNTASAAGLIAGPELSIYKVTKHGVVTLSETLHYELAELGSQVKVSVLCPGFVNTQIATCERNRPAHLASTATIGPEDIARYEALCALIEAGTPSAEVAETVFEAIREERFYILTHPEIKESIRIRMEDIYQERTPSPPLF